MIDSVGITEREDLWQKAIMLGAQEYKVLKPKQYCFMQEWEWNTHGLEETWNHSFLLLNT